MPELPEVEITIRDLNREIPGRKIRDIWSDWPKILHYPKSLKDFKKEILNKKIKKIKRRGKNILIYLDGKVILIHQKLTGHLLIGNWKLEIGNWKPLTKGPLEEPINRFIHLMFWLDDGRMLALSDLRKFAKVLVVEEDKFQNLRDIKSLGPDALDKTLSFEKFQKIIGSRREKIKQVLMDQKMIAGIGNIYSDEILWAAEVNPFKSTNQLSRAELKSIYKNMKSVLERAIKLRGNSISDFRDIRGKMGRYQEVQKVYRKENKPCPRCKRPIKRVKLAGRSAHFCPYCQFL